MPKKILITLPQAMLEQIDFVAMVEHRTRSDLVREALRRYLDNFKSKRENTLATAILSSPFAGARADKPADDSAGSTVVRVESGSGIICGDTSKPLDPNWKPANRLLD